MLKGTNDLLFPGGKSRLIVLVRHALYARPPIDRSVVPQRCGCVAEV